MFSPKKSKRKNSPGNNRKAQSETHSEEEKPPPTKILILGTGDAGKSTFCKQMQDISGSIQEEVDDRFVEILRDNCLESMKAILNAAKEWGVVFKDKEIDSVEAILSADEATYSEDIAKNIESLWSHPSIREIVVPRCNELQIPGGKSGAEYYFKNSHRFSTSNFQPTQEDIIRAKMRTTGILEIPLTFESSNFTIIDVGGQRSERPKWLNCFNELSTVIFIVALNEYDMVLEEDGKTNRMEESLKLFKKLSAAQWFDELPFILLFNKFDLFTEKLQRFPLSDTFIDYDRWLKEKKEEDGEEDWDSKSVEEVGYEYIKLQYVKHFGGAYLFPHKVSLIDKDCCRNLIEVIKSTTADK